MLGLVLLQGQPAFASSSSTTTNLNARITEAQSSWRQSNAAFWGEARPNFPTQNMLPEMQIQTILDRLVYVSPLRGYDIRARIKPDGDVNAFTDGKTIYIHSGLFSALGHNEDLLASVLAHELAHIVAHHKVERKTQAMDSILQIASPIVGQLVPYGSIGTQAVREMVKVKGFSYSRFQEKEADAIATILAIEAGYNPYGLSQFFDAVSHSHKGFAVPTNIPTNVTNVSAVSQSVALYLLRSSPFYKTHPPSQERKHVVSLMAQAKQPQMNWNFLQTQDPWLANIYEVVERRRPKNRG